MELEYNKVLSVLLIDYDNFKEREDADYLDFYVALKEDAKALLDAPVMHVDGTVARVRNYKGKFQKDEASLSKTGNLKISNRYGIS